MRRCRGLPEGGGIPTFGTMLQPKENLRVTVEEYLAYEAGIDGKAEYDHGMIYDMAGGSPAHNAIQANFAAGLLNSLGKRPCAVFSSDQKISIAETRSYYYPDLSVVCGPWKNLGDEPDTITNPVVIVEVCSPSSFHRDHGQKLDRYLLISSLREYVIVQQDTAQVDVYRRGEGGALEFVRFKGLDAVLHLSSIDVEVPLETIYRQVEFPLEEGSTDQPAEQQEG